MFQIFVDRLPKTIKTKIETYRTKCLSNVGHVRRVIPSVGRIRERYFLFWFSASKPNWTKLLCEGKIYLRNYFHCSGRKALALWACLVLWRRMLLGYFIFKKIWTTLWNNLRSDRNSQHNWPWCLDLPSHVPYTAHGSLVSSRLVGIH